MVVIERTDPLFLIKFTSVSCDEHKRSDFFKLINHGIDNIDYFYFDVDRAKELLRDCFPSHWASCDFSELQIKIICNDRTMFLDHTGKWKATDGFSKDLKWLKWLEEALLEESPPRRLVEWLEEGICRADFLLKPVGDGLPYYD